MKKDVLIIVSLFSVAFLIRAVGVSNICLNPDEFCYRSWGNLILANNWVPTAEVAVAFKYTNPFLSYLGAVVTVLFNGDFETIRMISVIFGSLTVSILYLFGKVIYDRKTGLLAAIFLCFSAYHCLYSRIFKFEALTLFFITAFLFFFWLSQRSEGRKSTSYAIIAGAMMGLAFDAKYISLILVPAVLAYVLWTNKFSFKALMDKQIILTFIFAFLFFLPLLICLYTTGVGLDPLYYQAFGRFEGEAPPSGFRPAGTRVCEYPIDQLFEKALARISDVLAWGSQALTPMWKSIFRLSVLLLSLIALFYYLYSFMNRERESGFLIISILSFIIILFFGSAGSKYYLLYVFPFYFVMLSHLIVKSFEHLRRENNYKNIFRIFIVSLAVIIFFSYVITGVTSPYWDKGEYLWAKSGVEYIKSDAVKSGYEGHITIGLITIPGFVEYSVYLSDFNASSTLILKKENKYSNELANVDLKKINILKPQYLIVDELYEYYLQGMVANEIFKDYAIVYHSQTYPYGCFVLKRKNTEPPEPLSPIKGKEGKISKDIFERSIPAVMKVGKIYIASVRVENTGSSRTNFTVCMHSDKYTIFVDEVGRSGTLDKGSTCILKFEIVPFKEYTGELPITVDLYAKDEENDTYIKVDSVSDYVYRIVK